MKNFTEQENACSFNFARLGKCYHLWTPEDFEIIFNNEQDFRIGMDIIGICAKLFPDIRILTFELMTNHLHITAAGIFARLMEMFSMIRKMLEKYAVKCGRAVNWDKFEAKSRELATLEDVRNVIVYNNRNGYVVSPAHTPFTYPWGANRYYFNPDACKLATDNSEEMFSREKRSVSHSHASDGISLMKYDGYALPLSFCDISAGESLFRDASHYFYRLSKSVERSKAIAEEIGESVFYTDNELFSAISSICLKRYSEPNPSLLPPSEKILLAKMLKYEYKASNKQILRILKLSNSILDSLGFSQ